MKLGTTNLDGGKDALFGHNDRMIHAQTTRAFESWVLTSRTPVWVVVGIVLKVLLVLGLPLAGPFAHVGAYVLLTLWALGGARRAIEALTLSWLLTFLNPGICSLAAQSDLLRWIVIAAAFVSVVVSALRNRFSIPASLVWLLAFSGVSAFLAVAVSYAPDVSLFKLVSFTLGAGTILWGFHLTAHEASYWRTWFLVLLAVVVFVSLPLIAMPLGYVRNNRGFQGILNHPQAYGTFLGVLSAWLTIMLFERRLWGIFPWTLLAAALASLFLTQSRTGAVAAVGAPLLCVAWNILRRPGVMRRGMTLLVRLSPVLIIGVIVILLNVQTIQRSIESFILKGRTGRAVAEAFHASRGDVIQESWANFQEHPITGIGFGVASDPRKFHVKRDSVLNLPVGASVEKGFLFSAVLEEVGILGFALFVGLIASILWPTFRSKTAMAPLALALGALLVNVGESLFFALGGAGLLVWLLFGAARAMTNEEPPWKR